ncbi:MAG: fructosamine kinase family protein [Cyclobacteriaceae bacterium]
MHESVISAVLQDCDLPSDSSKFKWQSISGGCINECFKVSIEKEQYFLKINEAMPLDFFEKEASGLDILQKNSGFNIPKVLKTGHTNSHGYLLLEFIDSAQKKALFWEDFGIQLAELHSVTHSSFGFTEDNYIGELHQKNSELDQWHKFFWTQRLQPQLKIAHENGRASSELVNDFTQLNKKLRVLLPVEPPALLHGDLWSGNFMTDQYGQATIIDLAVYFGHREAELAFTHLFGGFDVRFYKSYESLKPLESGFNERLDIYNLYPLLVHLNLFGVSYLQQIKLILKRFI